MVKGCRIYAADSVLTANIRCVLLSVDIVLSFAVVIFRGRVSVPCFALRRLRSISMLLSIGLAVSGGYGRICGRLWRGFG